MLATLVALLISALAFGALAGASATGKPREKTKVTVKFNQDDELVGKVSKGAKSNQVVRSEI